MNGKKLKATALIFVILLMIFSLSGCDRLKASIGFKWGQIQRNDHYPEVKNTLIKLDPVVKIEQNFTIASDSGTAFSRPTNKSRLKDLL